jgi:hypothetical protein
MRRSISVLLAVVISCIGYKLIIRQTKESRALQGKPSPASRHESSNIADSSSLDSGSAPTVVTPPPPTRPQRPKEGTLEEGIKTPWTRIQVALSVDDGCTGLHPTHELIISRGDNGMTIYGRVRMDSGEFAKTPDRSLSKEEFDEIATILEKFYRIAKKETDLGEHFRSLQPADREKQLEAYEQEHGIRYGGFDGSYFYVQFDSDKPDTIVTNAFNNPESVQSYVNWFQVWRRTCWATLDL